VSLSADDGGQSIPKNRLSSSGRLVMYVSTLLAGPAGALGFSGALAAAMSEA
jgi:hypothetical protein